MAEESTSLRIVPENFVWAKPKLQIMSEGNKFKMFRMSKYKMYPKLNTSYTFYSITQIHEK